MNNLESLIVLKNELSEPAHGPIRDYERFEVPSDLKSCVETIADYEKKLNGRLGGRGSDIGVALLEISENFVQHAIHCNPEKRVVVHYWRDDVRAYITIAAEGDGFDPRKVWLTKEEREQHRKHPYRGWGHMLIKNFSDFFAYDSDGKSAYIFFNLKEAA